MKKIISTLSFATFCILVFYSCRKAGTGGAYSIEVIPKHHDSIITASIIYLKYNAKDFPGTDLSVYDEQKTVDASHSLPHAHFTNLKRGNYYLYSVGFDSASSETVSGGIPIVIKDKTGESSITIPVTE